MISFYEILIYAQNNGITVYTSHLGELDALLHRVLKVLSNVIKLLFIFFIVFFKTELHRIQ